MYLSIKIVLFASKIDFFKLTLFEGILERTI